ncbi:pirin family protein [candidate division KSB1 bacterium]|nr:pirin family protein [candidate division KSB1 bacterium]
MSVTRKINKVFKSVPTLEGAGVHLKRAFGNREPTLLDPFLLLDDFHSNNPDEYIKGFPWHPHRGIETITYMLRGTVEHADSMGNKGTIHSGDVQWMTAGSGIIHQEMPKGEKGGEMWGLQLWANLPASSKMMAPRYRDIKSGNIPEVILETGTKIKVISGSVNGFTGPVRDIVIEPEYLDVFVPPDTTFNHPVRSDYTVFAYVLEGQGFFDRGRDSYAYEIEGASYIDLDRECLIKNESLVIYENGDHVEITTQESTLRFLLISGRPIREPVAWYGPVVMNTQDELRVAFQEFQNGTFIKHKK